MKKVKVVENGCKIAIGFDVDAITFSDDGNFYLPEVVKERIAALLRYNIAPQISHIILKEATFSFNNERSIWQPITDPTPKLHRNLPN